MSQPPANQQAQAAPANPNADVSGLKSGEYLLHIYVEETRALRHPKNADQTINPIIQVEAFGKKKISKLKEHVGSGATFWGEHFFFEKNFETTYEVEVERLTISVLDHGSFGLNALIGSVDFNISTIYQRDKHCMFYQWAALAGLTKEFQSVLGFIKFSIGVFAANDPQITLDQEKIPSERANSHALNVLYPPQINTQPYQLRIKVFKGEKLKKMDTFGQTDPFVSVEYGVLRAETSVQKITLDPVWNEELFIPVSFPTINNRIIVKLFDWEQAQTNELMGSNIFKIEDIKNKKYKEPFWVNIYGARAEAKVLYYKEMMNNIAETATMWKGRVQLSMTLEEAAQPILGTFPIKETKYVEAAAKAVKREKYDLRADIHFAMNLPKNDEKYSVRIRWGKIELASKKVTSKNRMIEIYETLTGTDEFPIGSSEDLEIPDVFIYINDGTKDFSYIRKDYKFFADPTQKPRCIFFQNDKACTEKRDDLAGIVKMRLCVNKVGENANQLALYGWNKNVEKRVSQTEWRIHLNVYQAKDMIPGDASGLSDPFMTAYFFGSEGKTTVIQDTVNPIWNERLEFAARFDSADDAPPFMLTLWDEDSMSNDFLGSSIVTIEKSDLNPTVPPPPKWITIRYGKGGQESGQILLSVCCYSRTDLIPRSPYIEPERQKYYINMKILGLRSLESIGLLPVKRAFVRFDIDSLKKKQDRSFLPEKKALVTEPLESGANPNIMTVINVEAMLPINPDFVPSMQCVVYDYIMKGMSQPRIGNFAVPLGDCIKTTKQELNKRIDTLTTFYHQAQEELRTRKVHERIASVAGIDMKQIEIVVDKQVLKEDIKDQQEVESLLNSEDPVEKAKASQAFVIISAMDKEGNETNTPDLKKYIALGYNKKDNSMQKHYRYLVDKELEKSDLIDESPFLSIPIYRGKKASDESFFSKFFTLVEDYRQVGQFNALRTEYVNFDILRIPIFGLE